jgi:hypothetical protein
MVSICWPGHEILNVNVAAMDAVWSNRGELRGMNPFDRTPAALDFQGKNYLPLANVQVKV